MAMRAIRPISQSFSVLFSALLLSIACISCGSHNQKKESEKSACPELDSLVAYLNSLEPKGDTLFLSKRQFTSYEYRTAMVQQDDSTYSAEDPTTFSEALFSLEPDIRNDQYVRGLALMHNAVTIYDFVYDAYSLSCALSEHPDSVTAEEYLGVSEPQSLIAKSISDSRIRKVAFDTYKAYRGLDGDTTKLKHFFDMTHKYQETSAILPRAATPEMLKEYNKRFDDWYLDSLSYAEAETIKTLRYKLQEQKVQLPSDHIYSFGIRTWSEPDIDKRAALALEYVQWRETEGLEMLGDIMESGIYTKYLLEIWYTWRAICQSFSFSASSSGFIPNRYYSKMKVKCANTILRHIQETDDLMAKCLLDELLMYPMINRYGSILGNEAYAMAADLRYSGFVPYHIEEQREIEN